MIAARAFHFRPLLTICAGVALAILIGLGSWQLQRRDWKNALIENVESSMRHAPASFSEGARSAKDEYAPVYVEGAFLDVEPARVFGTLDGAPGVYLFSPFETVNGAVVYVNRGFVPQTDVTRLALPPDGGTRRVEGLLRVREIPAPPASWFKQTGVGTDGYWYVRDPAAMAVAAGARDKALGEFYIDQFAVDGADWPKGGTTRLDFRNKHLEYALTWFGLAGALIAVWLAMSLRPRD